MSPKVLFFQRRDSAYTNSLFLALQRIGIHTVDAEFAGGWLNRNACRGDVALLHWPSFLYRFNSGSAATMKAFLRFVALIGWMRLRGVRWVWVAHNLLPHDHGPMRWIDVAARHVLIRLADRVLVHGQHASQALVKRFPASAQKLTLIPHGHWIDEYPHSITLEQARQRLGLAQDARVLLFIGACKPYKQLHELVALFRSSNIAEHLVIAGKFQDPAYERQIKALIGDDSRILLHSRFIPDDELQIYLKACNAVVAPYREILTSGTAMLAMTFGRPMVSVRLGFLRDIISEHSGVLFDPEDPNGLSRALADVCDRHYDEQEIMRQARRYSFEGAATQIGAFL